MLVRFKRNWFGPDGVRYRTRDGLAEVGDDLRDQLPKDAEIISETKTLPDKAIKPLPGFGAIPAHEQALADLGAAPTHQITSGAGEGQEPSKGDFIDDGAAHRKLEADKPALRAEEDAERQAVRDKQVAADRIAAAAVDLAAKPAAKPTFTGTQSKTKTDL